MEIREAKDEDLHDVLEVERLAFGEDEEAELVRALLNDPTAQPLISLLAFEGKRAVGHVLFTSASLVDPESELKVSLLAPLAVVPDKQRLGIGGSLIRDGVARLRESNIDLVFVLGHPEYYPKHEFEPARVYGYEAPYVIPDENADAWMVRVLGLDIIGFFRGRVDCADALKDPKYWRE